MLFSQALRSWLTCFGQNEGVVKLAENDSDTRLGCTFCNISHVRGFDVIWKNSTLVVFRDHDPAAREHLLVVPVNHIRSVKSLRRQDVPLLKDMEAAGHHALDSLNIAPEKRSRTSNRLGFHIPPFNSVMHLHLHAQGLPYKSAYRLAKFPVSRGRPGNSKGFSWFVEIGQAIDILERDGMIGVLPC